MPVNLLSLYRKCQAVHIISEEEKQKNKAPYARVSVLREVKNHS